MKSILIIEDDRVMQVLLRNLFIEAGYSVNSIMDGKDLIDDDEIFSTDLIIVDMMIPHLYESSDLINLYKNRKAPIIVISAIDKDDGIYFTKKINGQAFFNKPFNPKELLNTVNTLINKKKEKILSNS